MKKKPEASWMGLEELAPLLGIKPTTLKNLINAHRAPLPTYKLGRRHVADREVVASYFAEKKRLGLKQIRKRKKP